MEDKISKVFIGEGNYEKLEKIIEENIKLGYKIQDSNVEWYCGMVQYVYVFVKKEFL